MWLIFTGFFVHVVFLISVFDIYFKSPIVHDIIPHSSPLAPPAKRLVLFVADGLRADTLYGKLNTAPYLRSVLTERGAWGVSHTRVPTETRPGHVALIAGLYEDPSAIARGWKENPVEFDSVFNRSRQTWSWGSPDILPMFAKGASGNHVWMEMYDANMEDFSGKTRTSNLDTWVFDKVKSFFDTAKQEPSLLKKLNKDKIIFFLHLLGLDTAGHTHKPHSEEYEENLQVVDNGIKEIEQIFEQFYEHDDMTVYVFTSDHGMTDWGSHGSGDTTETETPIIAWGAGVSGPKSEATKASQNPDSWRITDLARRDVKQADIAPLMASLIGISFPVNSVGFLPRDYLNVTQEQLAEAVFANARQITAQYRKKRDLTEDGTISWLYRPFAPLDGNQEISITANIRHYINDGKYNEAIFLSEELVKLSMAGLDYYQTYYQCLLLTCMTLAFLGWIVWLLWTLLDIPFSKYPHAGGLSLNSLFILLTVATVYLIYAQQLPVQLQVYCLLPQFLWWGVARQYDALFTALRRLKTKTGFSHPLFKVFLYLLGVEILVASFFYRFTLSIGMLGIALWPLTAEKRSAVPKLLVLGWLMSCILLAIFPMLPVLGKEANINLLLFTGLFWVVFAIGCLLCYNLNKVQSSVLYITLIQIFMLLLAIWNIHSIHTSLKVKIGLPLLNQLLSWTLFGFSMCLPLLNTERLMVRLLNIILSLVVPFLLLSASHEGLFLLALSVNMICWLAMEHYQLHSSCQLFETTVYSPDDKKMHSQTISSTDFRRGYCFLFYVILSFFGTGNIASINSFDPTWVTCFVTVFSPFLMTVLILWKTLVPILIVTCTFRVLNIIIQAPTEKLFLIVFVLCDMMGLHFLHLVKNQGSWLDIGTSISHFVIIETITLFLVLMYAFARLLTDVTLWHIVENFRHPHSKHLKLSLETAGKGDVINPVRQNYLLKSTLFEKRHVE